MKEFFSEGEFRVAECEENENAESWIFHLCEAFTKSRELSRYEGELLNGEIRKERCSFCRVSIPPSVIALWRLHNWDYKL